MKWIYGLILVLLLLAPTALSAQVNNGIALRFRSGTSLPATCSISSVFYKTSATTGQYNCTAVDTWTLAAGSASAITGSGTSNQIAYFTSASALSGSSVVTLNATYGTVMIGLTMPDVEAELANIYSGGTQTAIIGGDSYGIFSDSTITSAENATGATGLFSRITYDTTGFTFGEVDGAAFSGNVTNSGTSKTGTLITGATYLSNISGNTTVTSLMGVYAKPNGINAPAVATSNYGIYADTQTGGSSNYSIYSAGTVSIATASTVNVLNVGGTAGFSTTVTINTTTTTSLLNVGGTLRVTGASTFGSTLGIATSISINTTGTTGALNSAGTAYLSGLTTSAGLQAFALCLAGNSQVIADSVACLASSESVKHDIKPVSDGALDLLMKLKPVTFVFNNDGFPPEMADWSTHYGFIAERVAEVVPTLAIYKGGKPVGVDYQMGTAFITKALQELTERVKQLEKNQH